MAAPGLRVERLLEAGLPPGIRRGMLGFESGFDRPHDRLRLLRGELDLHSRDSLVPAVRHLFEGFAGRFTRFTPSGDVRHLEDNAESPQMRHPVRRTLMLQWNSKTTALVMIALLVALAAVVGNFTWGFFNFTW